MKLRNFLTLRTALAAAAVWLVLSGAALLYFGSVRTVTVWLDGVQQHVATRSLTVNGVLRDAGYTPSTDDLVTPPSGAWLRPGQGIRVDRARLVQIYTSARDLRRATLVQRACRQTAAGSRHSPVSWRPVVLQRCCSEIRSAPAPASSYLLQYSPPVSGAAHFGWV
jgi:hypothetical protein